MSLKFILFGAGQIGTQIANLALSQEHQLVNVIDIDKNKVGKLVSKFIRHGSGTVKDKLEETAEMAIISTSSYLSKVKPQIVEAVENGMSAISTCEELVYPWVKNRPIAKFLDKLAKKHGVSILGTGVNPGFVMDFLPIVMSLVSTDIKNIEITRTINPIIRRTAFQQKVGIGLKPDQFRIAVREKTIGHIGLIESLHMISDLFEWPTTAKENITPIIKKGRVIGLKQGVSNRKIKLNFEAYKDAIDRDIIVINGNPKIKLEIKPGIFGDTATAAIVVRMMPKVFSARPGLLTMRDFVR